MPACNQKPQFTWRIRRFVGEHANRLRRFPAAVPTLALAASAAAGRGAAAEHAASLQCHGRLGPCRGCCASICKPHQRSEHPSQRAGFSGPPYLRPSLVRGKLAEPTMGSRDDAAGPCRWLPRLPVSAARWVHAVPDDGTDVPAARRAAQPTRALCPAVGTRGVGRGVGSCRAKCRVSPSP
jgi:hypothetical protein